VRKAVWPILFGVLLIANGALLWQNRTLSHSLIAMTPPQVDQPANGEESLDVRGIYTLPSLGRYFLPDTVVEHAPTMSIVVFLSTKTTCPASMSEIDVFKRLLPELQRRNQTVVAVCAPEDSAGVASFLDSVALSVPLTPVASTQFSFEQMGISTEFMPFKIVLDSTFTAVYMRGSDNSAESQEEFERAVRFLSDMFAS